MLSYNLIKINFMVLSHTLNALSNEALYHVISKFILAAIQAN